MKYRKRLYILSDIESDNKYRFKHNPRSSFDGQTYIKLAHGMTCTVESQWREVFPSKHLNLRLDYTSCPREIHKKTNFIDKDAAVVNIPWSDNYGHCLHDVLPYICYLDSLKKFQIYTSHTRMIESLMETYDLNLHDVKFVDKSCVITNKHVHMFNEPITRDKQRSWALKKHIDNKITKLGICNNNRLIYCTRNIGSGHGHKRPLDSSCENEIVSMLRQHCEKNNLHFTLFYNEHPDGTKMSHLEQMMLFSEAKIVVGPHGSAMANCIYLNPGNDCKICEFTSGTQKQIHGGVFDKHYANLFDYIFEDYLDYYLIPFTRDSTGERSRINTDNLNRFLNMI